jgi:hypothetical protein
VVRFCPTKKLNRILTTFFQHHHIIRLCCSRVNERLGIITDLLIWHPQLICTHNQKITLLLSKRPRHLLSSHLMTLLPLNRSGTPDPAYGPLASMDHILLSRCSTAPAAESFADILPANGKHDPTMRYMASANELTRMGSLLRRERNRLRLSVSPRGHKHKLRFRIKSFSKTNHSIDMFLESFLCCFTDSVPMPYLCVRFPSCIIYHFPFFLVLPQFCVLSRRLLLSHLLVLVDSVSPISLCLVYLLPGSPSCRISFCIVIHSFSFVFHLFRQFN